MSRKAFIYVLGALLCMMQMGCVDDSYRGMIDVEGLVDEVEPQKILMFVGNSNEITIGTKGHGVVGTDGLDGKIFYVYSFLRGNLDMSYEPSCAENDYTCLIDASIDDPSSIHGRPVFWNPETNVVEWAFEAEPLYYPVGESRGLTYDFFAYYVDDMDLDNEDFHRSDDAVTIDIEIDGSQDIMSSVSKPSEEELARGAETEEEISYRESCSYSYYTAQCGIHPRFVFKHHLVKLDFKLVPGTTSGMTKNMIVDKIEVVSKNKGQFIVAAINEDNLGVSFSGDRVPLMLKEADGSDYIPRELSTSVDGTSDGVINDLGSLLVAPDDEYELLITLTEKNYITGEPLPPAPPMSKTLYLGKEGNLLSFEGGNEYLVTLTIFGQMDVRVTTELTDWNYGGDYGYDYDETTRPKG